MTTDFVTQAKALREELVTRRRDLHRHPEIAFEEVRTAGIVATELNNLGLEVMTGVGKTGVVGILEGKRDGPTVLVRCDMDALPVAEANKTDYISETPGKMHACGHDGHTAIGLAVAKMFTAHRDQIAGRIKFVFQPAEEIGRGADAMIKDGVLEAPRPQVSLGLHLWNELSIGQVSVTEGPAMASASDVIIRIRGVGGHGAMPENTHDPIVAGAQIITALQTAISRNVGGLDTAILSICKFHAGFAKNVIPSEAELAGTFRAFRPETQSNIASRIQEIAVGVGRALGCEVEMELDTLCPPLINDSATNKRLRAAFSKAAPDLTVLDSSRTMASEDMAWFLNNVPGTFFFVGSANAARGLNYAHHHPQFDFDEDALPIGAGLLATAIADYVMQ
jgi:amidohydrolase